MFHDENRNSEENGSSGLHDESNDGAVETEESAGERCLRFIPRCLEEGPMDIQEIVNHLGSEFNIHTSRPSVVRYCQELEEEDEIIKGGREAPRWETVYFLPDMIQQVRAQTYGQIFTLHLRMEEHERNILDNFFRNRNPEFHNAPTLRLMVRELGLSPDRIMELGSDIAAAYRISIIDDRSTGRGGRPAS